MAKAISEAFTTIISSSSATVAGFAALCFMDLTLGKDIGIVMMKGVVLGVFSTLTILPSLILVFDKPIHKYTHKSIIPSFGRCSDFIIEAPQGDSQWLFLLLIIPAALLRNQTAALLQPSAVAAAEHEFPCRRKQTEQHVQHVDDKLRDHQRQAPVLSGAIHDVRH